jgi:hypothetical protein
LQHKDLEPDLPGKLLAFIHSLAFHLLAELLLFLYPKRTNLRRTMQGLPRLRRQERNAPEGVEANQGEDS